ncbi:MAG: WYL domain-containing protein [candidate division Zixibacteria bacterium]|nr:WYL domain-containing protein [candidate division Zixibacteria bacterium]
MTAREPTKTFLNSRTFIAFDTETTGMWAAANRVVEIGAVKFQPGRDEYETFQSLINPERPIPEDVIEIHGITDEMVAGQETVRPVLERFIDFCGKDSILIAHNAPFDISFISCELDRTGLTFGDNLIIDTVDIARRFFPQLPSYSLLSLSKQFDIVEFQNHRALSDALMVWKLFLRIKEKFPPVANLREFKKLLTTYTMSQWKVEQRELPEEYLPLKQAIDNNLPVEIVYAGVGKAAQARVIRPIEVHCLGAIFYINAFCEKAKAERTFRLDRIESFRLLTDQ